MTVSVPKATAMMFLLVFVVVIVIMLIQRVILIVLGSVQLKILGLVAVVDTTEDANGHSHAECDVSRLTTHLFLSPSSLTK